MLDGPRSGERIDAYLTGPSGSQDTSTYAAGQEVVVTFTKTPDGSQDYIEVSDRWRLPGLAGLALICAIAVVIIGGWQGVRALVALGLTAVIILKILLPLIIAGVPPVPLAVLTASGVTVVTILMTEGWKRSSIAAILGTTGALALTGLLAAITTSLLGFTYTAGSDLAFLATPGGGGLDLRGVLLAAIILGAVGVLDDVTVTQAALVDEMAHKGRLHGRPLVVSAMTIGRSHIGATVNTLFLAYVGVGLPLLVLLMVSAQPSAAVLNDELIATEIVRTLIGSLGIVMAIPLTTFIAVPARRRGHGRGRRTPRPQVTEPSDHRRRGGHRRPPDRHVGVDAAIATSSALDGRYPRSRCARVGSGHESRRRSVRPGCRPGRVGRPAGFPGRPGAHRPGTARTDHRRWVDRRHRRRVDARAQRRNDAGFLDGLGPSRVSRGRRRRIPSGDWLLGAPARRRDGDPTPADRRHRNHATRRPVRRIARRRTLRPAPGRRPDGLRGVRRQGIRRGAVRGDHPLRLGRARY